MRANMGLCGSQSARARSSSCSGSTCGASPPRKRGVAGELIERLVLCDALADPIVEDFHPAVVELALLDLEEVGPLQGPKIGELGALEQRVDEPGALVGRGVGDEGLGGFDVGHESE